MAPVTAAIALWNTIYLGRGLNTARRRGEVISDALLAHLAPLGWHKIAAQHICQIVRRCHRVTVFVVYPDYRAILPVV